MQNIAEETESLPLSSADEIVEKIGVVIAENLNAFMTKLISVLGSKKAGKKHTKKEQRFYIKSEFDSPLLPDSGEKERGEDGEENDCYESGDSDSDSDVEKPRQSSALIYYEQEMERKRKWGNTKIDQFTKDLKNESHFLAIFAMNCPPLFAVL
jgi:hypothetical protein